MIFLVASVVSLLHLVACDISVQGFDDTQCAGNRIGTNVHSNAGNLHESSNCIASDTFESISTISVDAGFQCNIYSDTACQNFITSTNTVGCVPVIGQGLTCFSQASFDNPLAGSTGNIGIGKNKIIASTGDETFERAISNACGDAICDPTSRDVLNFIHGRNCEGGLADVNGNPFLTVCDNRDQCTQTITVNGQFDNTQQRDYMKGLLKATMKQGIGGFVQADSRDTSPNDQLSFASVVINDAKGADLASMSMSIEVQCTEIEPDAFNCDQPFIDILKTLVGAIPAVGETIASTFEVACAVNDLING
ncbi:uncharacterized protein A1O9_11995 [Exophiala aquamarina CBS 119918]|uniref:Uncharacterized protein n=1 Tax=Exophiala aquamarina CBS 119918 TaxID=1182545 RepID=A0A072P8U0_9EURO|nr:uncharacterized protein A1O9_11995 [Exophiala aquamarina CBS 119918]KEF52005.1 hypothetical protein A1O9_11995 [Exophiala aquamarina CBS 119918]